VERETEIVTLSDKRKVTIQETTGLDEMIAQKIIGKDMKNQGDLINLPAVLLTMAISEINGEKFSRPNNLVAVQSFMGSLKSKDKARLEMAYQRLNQDVEVENDQGEEQAAESD
jgi:hypothetical protein